MSPAANATRRSKSAKSAKVERVAPLDRIEWIRVATRVLADEGVGAVRVEVIARRMKITKGSFYWHFRDRAELLAGVLSEWRRTTMIENLDYIREQSTDPHQRLSLLWRMCRADRFDAPGGTLEAALRQWAGSDSQVRKILFDVDEERIQFIQGLYDELGRPRSRALAMLFYGYVIGRNTAYHWSGALDDRKSLRDLEALLAI